MNENFVLLVKELDENKEAIIRKKVSDELTSQDIMERGKAKFQHFKAMRHFITQC